jgi:hypothetical protein
MGLLPFPASDRKLRPPLPLKLCRGRRRNTHKVRDGGVVLTCLLPFSLECSCPILVFVAASAFRGKDSLPRDQRGCVVDSVDGKRGSPWQTLNLCSSNPYCDVNDSLLGCQNCVKYLCHVYRPQALTDFGREVNVGSSTWS